MKLFKALLVLLLCSITSISLAQIEMGLNGGLTNRNLVGKNVATSGGLSLGFTGNLDVTFPLDEHIFLQSGVGLERKGYNAKTVVRDDNGNSLGETRFYHNLDYLIVPIQIGYQIGEFFTWHAQGGIFYGQLMRVKSYQKRIDGFPIINTSNENPYGGSDLGISVGAGMSIPLSEIAKVTFNIKHNRGLISMIYDSDFNLYTSSTIFQVGICSKL